MVGSDPEGADASTEGLDSGPEMALEKPASGIPLPRWPFALAALVVVGFVGGVLWAIFRPKPDVWTDDAYVRVHYATIAPRVSGQVVSVAVDDNQIVGGSDLLVQLDDRDYRAAELLAQANLDRAKAMLANAAAAVARQRPTIEQAKQQLVSAQAQLDFAREDAARYERMAQTGSGTIQSSQRTTSSKLQGEASVTGSQAAVDVAQKQLEVLQAQEAAAEAAVQATTAQLRQARLNLSYTRILAPVDGMVAARSVQVGDVVASGTTLMTVVPLSEVYITANYLETQLRHVRTGQPVTFHVDAYDIDLKGRVNAVPAASGATFAPIAPNNATGNFTKIVQRLPVRIDIEPGQPLAKFLRVGFSVEATIHTHLEDVVTEQGRDPNPITGR